MSARGSYGESVNVNTNKREKNGMSEMATPSAGGLDNNTIMDGLISIGVRLYESVYDIEREARSLAEAERAVFAVLFAPNWRALTDDWRALARTVFPDDEDVFDQMLADVERRVPGEVSSSILGMTFAEARATVEADS
jgi:hypothetical protein